MKSSRLPSAARAARALHRRGACGIFRPAMNDPSDIRPNGRALIPFLVFVAFYLGL